jgi:hypothetical protein
VYKTVWLLRGWLLRGRIQQFGKIDRACAVALPFQFRRMKHGQLFKRSLKRDRGHSRTGARQAALLPSTSWGDYDLFQMDKLFHLENICQA